MRLPPIPVRGTVNVNSGTGCLCRSEARSERIPRRFRRELQVADVRAKPQTDSRADRNNDNAVRGERRHADAANKVGRAVDAGEPLVDRTRRGKVIDQHHGAGAFTAYVPAKGRSLPVNAQVAGVLRIECALAVTQPPNESAPAFLTQDVAVVLAPRGESTFDPRRQPARDTAEEAVPGVENFVRRIALGRLSERGRGR